jgi:hypothetical protein
LNINETDKLLWLVVFLQIVNNPPLILKTSQNTVLEGNMSASRKPAAQPRRIGPALPVRMAPLLQRLRRDQSGNVAMLFGLLVIPLAAMMGLAVDFGRRRARRRPHSAAQFEQSRCHGVRGRDSLFQSGQAP